MKFKKTALGLLVPIQYEVNLEDIIRNLPIFDFKNYKPLAVVAYGKKYLIGDGHHRAVSLFLAGESEARIQLLENDDDVASFEEGAFYLRKSIKEFIDATYENDPFVKENIFSIERLLEHNKKDRNLVETPLPRVS